MGVGAFTQPEKLEAGKRVEGFRCGVQIVDDWVRIHAHRAEEQGTAVPYVTRCDGVVAGIYTLCPYSVKRSDVPGGWLKRNVPEQIPAILLGMFAVDERFWGMGLGAQLLKDAVRRAASAAQIIGGRALLVEPANGDATSFYAHYGFREIEGTGKMYLRLVQLG